MPRSVFRRLSWQTCSSKSGTTDSTKKVVLYFMPFGTYNRLLIAVLPGTIEIRHLCIEFFVSEFQAHHLNLRPSTDDENIQKEPAFVPCWYVFKLKLLILFECLEKLSGKFDPQPLLIGFQWCGISCKLNFSKCKSSRSTRKQVAVETFSLRQSTLHEMNGNCCNNNWIGAARPLRKGLPKRAESNSSSRRPENAVSTLRPSHTSVYPCHTHSGVRWRFRQRWGFWHSNNESPRVVRISTFG
jgi:hypothetical protein